MKTADFDFDLPRELIATRPMEPREAARLLEVRQSGAPGEGRGRLIFAHDATMSRQPTWDTACRRQAEMFEETGKTGGLAVMPKGKKC